MEAETLGGPLDGVTFGLPAGVRRGRRYRFPLPDPRPVLDDVNAGPIEPPRFAYAEYVLAERADGRPVLAYRGVSRGT